MKKGTALRLWIPVLALLCPSFLCFNCNHPAGMEIGHEKAPGEAYPDGKKLFEAYCIDCHGKEARGTGSGPPLVHEIYRSDHHGDGSFYHAMQKGVEAHHWQFGDMPAIPEIKTKKQADQILQYLRGLQRQAGIR